MKKQFFSGTRYKIQAVNQERLLTSLSKKVPIFGVSRTSYTTAEICVKPQNKKQFEKELKAKNVKILEKTNLFLFAFFANFVKKIGVLAGICFCLGVFLISGQFVFQTKIVGLEAISEAEVVQILNQNNFSGFSLKRNLNTKQIESAISKHFNNISLVSVIIKGNTLIVSIKEKISAGEYDNPEDFKPLTAKFDGLITNINLISGTLKVAVGQIVRVGDVLVEPYVLDSSNNVRVVKAEAEVLARVWLRAKHTHYEKRLETTRTGRVQTQVNLFFLGIKLSGENFKLKFESYESTSVQTYISQNNILPIVREAVTYYETQTKEVIEPFESVKDKVFEKAKQKALQMLENYEIITKEYFTENTNFGVTHVEYVIELNKLIN